jgi:glucose-1-phosphate cytidylyltransferase
MKAVILAGGLGTRLSEETGVKPKPMVTIGGMPILWHIMKCYSSYGINEFVIKEYFANYFLHMSDVTFDMQKNEMEVHSRHAEPWRVTVVDTGDETMTGGRIKRVGEYVAKDDAFCLTYGDGLSDVDIGALIAFHRSHGKLATLTAAQPPGRFGALHLEGTVVKTFLEKPQGDGAWINGGFFVLSPKILDYIDGDDTIWERKPMERLAADDQLRAYFHEGFWQPMDTLRDRVYLESLWDDGKAPWKI